MNFKNISLLAVLALSAACNAPQHKAQTGVAADSLITDSSVNASVKAADNLEAIIKKESNLHPRVDTILLGFAFGMSESGVKSHFQQLVKAKKLVYNDTRQRYEYPMALKYFKASAALSPEYHDDKLYRMNLIVSSDDPKSSEEAVYVFTATLYEDKYGGENFFIEPSAIGGDKTYHWVKHNLHIEVFKNVEGTIVSYIDLPVIQVVDKEKNAETEKTKSDI